MDDNKEIRDLLKPRRDIKASHAFREMIEGEMSGRGQARKGAKWLWRGLAVGSVAAALVLLFIPKGLSAKEILRDAISAIRETYTIEIEADIRTESREIFDYINPESEFVQHMILVHRSDSATYWYVNKGERAAEKNADGLYVWIEPYNIGWLYPEHNFDVLGYLSLLLNPEKILESELQYTLSAPEADYDIAKKDGEIVLTIHSMPKGDYSNPYVLNTSVEDSESIRRYVLDGANHHLKSASVSMVVEGKEIEALKVTNINYNPQIKSLPPIPANVTFINDVEHALPSGIPGLDARETASVFLRALSNWDTDVLHRFISPIEAEVLRQKYEGANLLALGAPFRSGSNPYQIFIPYTLQFSDGSMRKKALALVRYPGTAWCFDGGL